MGLATYNQNSQDVIDKIILTRMNNYNGISIFSYTVFKYNATYSNKIRKYME